MSVITTGIQDKRHAFTFSCFPIFHDGNPVGKDQEQFFVKARGLYSLNYRSRKMPACLCKSAKIFTQSEETKFSIGRNKK